MFKKPVIVAVAINIKGIGFGGGFEARVLSIKLAVREGENQIFGGGCYSLLAILPARPPSVEGV